MTTAFSVCLVPSQPVLVATFATPFNVQSMPDWMQDRAVFSPDLREVTVSLEPSETLAFIAQLVATLEPSAEAVTISAYAPPLDILGE